MHRIIQKIALYGDSLFRGVVLSSDNHRYRIAHGIDIEGIARQYALEVSNNSKFGYTIDRGFSVLRRNLEQGAHYDAVLLEYGGNDCNFDWAKVAAAPDENHDPCTPRPLFHKIYVEIIAYLRDRGITPVLSTLPPLCPERFLNWVCRDGVNSAHVLHWLGDVGAIYRYQEMYSREVERIAQETGAPVIDIRGAFLEQRRLGDFMCEDGMHPNERGQHLIHMVISDFAEQKKDLFLPA